MATIAKLVVELGMDQKDFTSGIETSTKSLEKWGKGMMAVGGIITGAIAAPIIAGSKAAWDQVNAVEQATIAMSAYADSTEQVDAVLADLLDYARSDMGVLFSRQELFSAAQSMLMYGASIDEVAGYTEILSRSVGLGLSNWDDLNRVIGRVGSTGRLTGNDFDYLKAAGFDLDDSLRNTNMTWEELMVHLDNGIPADALAGQADTIRGKTIRLQSALRGLGLAFLGVDSETSKFIEGGLGDTMFKGMSQLTELMRQAAPAVQQFGTWVGDSASKLSGLVDWFLALPQPLKTALLLFTGISGVALTLGGAFVLVSAKVMGFMKVVSGLGGLTGIVKGFGVALRALTLTNPLFWALAAAVGAFVAYRNNFMGFRDIVNRFARDAQRYISRVIDVFNDVRTVVSYFGRTWQSAFSAFVGAGNDPVSAGFMAVRQALYQVSVVAGPLGGILRTVGDAFGGMRNVVSDVVASFDYFKEAAAGVRSAVGFLLDGEWGKAFASLKDAAVAGFAGVMTALDSVLDAFGQLGGWMIDRLGDLGSRLWSWFVGQLQSVDWAGAFSAALGVLASAGSWIIDKLGSATEAIQTWFSSQFGGVDFVSVAVDAAQRLGTALGAAVGSMVGIYTDVYNWLADQINSVNWNGIGTTIGEWLGIAIKAGIGLILLAGELLIHFGREIASVDWFSLAESVWNLLKAALLGALDLLAGIAEGLYTELLAGVTGVSWGELGTTIINGLWTGAQNLWTTVTGWFASLGSLAYTAIGNLSSTLLARGNEIISGFYEAITTRWVAVRQWFVNLPTMIFNAVGSLARTLWDRGTQALTGLYMAVIDKWSIGGVRNWFTGLGSRIVSAVGDLGSSLYNAGAAIMQGLWDGLRAKWGEITNWLSGLNPAEWKGPERRDKKMLYKPGIWIMEGLGRGLDDGWDNVTRQLSSYTPSINGALDAAHANRGGGTTINHNYFVTPEALKEMIEGGKFAREFAGDLAMSEGVA